MASKWRITEIQPNECIGNSLNTINTNFSNLQIRADEQQTFSNSIVDFVNNGLIFQPVNFANRSNDTVIIERESPANKNLNSKPWWSKSYKVAIPKIPSKCVGVLVHVFYNVNAIGNNQQAFYVKDRNVRPNSDVSPDKKEQARYNLKFTMDPTEGSNGRGYEAESDVTFPVYLDDSNKNGCTPNTFHWRISDNRNERTTRAPEYRVRIHLLGYYLDLNLNKLV